MGTSFLSYVVQWQRTAAASGMQSFRYLLQRTLKFDAFDTLNFWR